MNKIILSTLLIFGFYFVNAQRKNEIQILKSGTVNPSLIKEDWLVQVQNLESPSPSLYLSKYLAARPE